MTISAGLESFFKWDHKSGAFYSLAVCAASLYKMHDEWHRVASEYISQPTPDHLGKVLKLADSDLEAINSKIVDIHNRAAELGVTDLALKLSSLSSKDMFNVAFGQTRDALSSDGNGRPADDRASLERTS